MSLEQHLEAKRIVIALLKHRVPSRVIIGWGVDQELVLESANELKQAAPPPRSEDVHVAPVVAHNPVPYAQHHSSAPSRLSANHSSFSHPSSSAQVPYQQHRQHDVVQVQPQHQLEQRTQQFERQAPPHLPQRPPPPPQQQRQPYQQPVHDLVEGQRQVRTQHALPLDYDPLNPSATLPKTQLASFSSAPLNSQAQPFQPKHLRNPSSTASVESSTNQSSQPTPATVQQPAQPARSHQPTPVVHTNTSAQPSSTSLSVKLPSTESTNAAETESKKAPTLPRPTSRTPQAQAFRVPLASSNADPLAARFSYRAGVNDVLKGAFPASSSSQPHTVESFPYERLRKLEAVHVTLTSEPSVEGWTPDSTLLSPSSKPGFFDLGGSSAEYVELEEGDVTVTVTLAVGGADADAGDPSATNSSAFPTDEEGDTYSHLPGYENVRLSSLVRSSHHPNANAHPDVPELDTDTTRRSGPSSSAPSTVSESDGYTPPPCHEDDDYIGPIHGHRNPRTVNKLADVQDSLAASWWAADWARDRAGLPRGTESVKSADTDDKAKGKVDKGKGKAADIGTGIEAELEKQTKEDVAVLPENDTDGGPGDLTGDIAVKRAEPHVCVNGSECPRYTANHPEDCTHGPWHPPIVCQDYAERLGCSKLQNGAKCLDAHVPLEVSRRQPPGWCPQGKECKSRRNGRCLTKMWGLVPGKKTHQENFHGSSEEFRALWEDYQKRVVAYLERNAEMMLEGASEVVAVKKTRWRVPRG